MVAEQLLDNRTLQELHLEAGPDFITVVVNRTLKLIVVEPVILHWSETELNSLLIANRGCWA